MSSEPNPGAVEAPEGVNPDALLTAALAAAQAEFPAITKGNTATVTPKGGGASYSYSYADLGDVLAAVRPVLSKHGLAIVQRTIRSANGTVLVTELRHAGGGILESEVDLGQSSANPQQFGGALTYLRRYELTTLIGVAAEDDNDAKHVEPRGRGDAAPASLPAFALAAAPATIKTNLENVAVVIGQPRAVALAQTIREKCDGDIPNIVAFALGTLALAVVEELDPLAIEAAAERRTADAARAAQDAAAEAPDTPAPTDAPPAEEEPVEEVGPEPPPADPAAADRPAPGSVSVERGDREGIELVKALQDAGCICEQPLVAERMMRDESAAKDPDCQRVTSTECPVSGHGIGF